MRIIPPTEPPASERGGEVVMANASHRFNNNLRYRTNDHPNQRQLTPPYVLEPIRAALGGIELDPCTEPDNPTKAERFFTASDDGLAQPWAARSVFVNPPYGKAREPWVDKCIIAADEGSSVILLIPSHTDTRTFHRLTESADWFLFLKGRVKFGVLRNNGRQEAASHPSVLVGWNVDADPVLGLGACLSRAHLSGADAQLVVLAAEAER